MQTQHFKDMEYVKNSQVHVYIPYHSEILGLADWRQPGAGFVDSASWTALWEQSILGQQVKGGMTQEHLQRSEYTMRISLNQDKKSQCRYSAGVEYLAACPQLASLSKHALKGFM